MGVDDTMSPEMRADLDKLIKALEGPVPALPDTWQPLVVEPLGDVLTRYMPSPLGLAMDQIAVLLPVEGQQYTVEFDCLHMGLPPGMLAKLCPLCLDTNGKLSIAMSRVSVDAGPLVLKKKL